MRQLISWILKHIPRTVLQRWSPLFRHILGYFLRGKNVTCPINNKSYSKFLPYGRNEHARENAFCPESLSLERHRLIWLYLKNKTNFFKNVWQVLHIAPEMCFIDAFQRQHGDTYISADLESPLAKVLLNIEEIPFPENTFDFIMCNHVLEHVDSDRQAIKELYRVMKKGGWGILQVPFYQPIQPKTIEDITITSPKEREREFGQRDHVRKYGLDYKTRLEAPGFEVIVDNYVATFSEEEVARYGLDINEKLYIVRKEK